jgi:hypothetical protein
MVLYEQFTVEVRGNGVELPTFNDPEPLPQGVERTVVKYVQAEAGTPFSIYWFCGRAFPSSECDVVVAQIFCDGLFLDSLWLDFFRSNEFKGLESRDPDGMWYKHPLRFGTLATCLTIPSNLSREADLE